LLARDGRRNNPQAHRHPGESRDPAFQQRAAFACIFARPVLRYAATRPHRQRNRTQASSPVLHFMVTRGPADPLHGIAKADHAAMMKNAPAAITRT
jgi:hypothetical protein